MVYKRGRVTRSYEHPRLVNGGKPAWRMYVFLRKHHQEMAAVYAPGPGEVRRSERQIATYFGVTHTFMSQARDLLTKFMEPIAKGDFEVLERHLFEAFGDYKLQPFYARMLAELKLPAGSPPGVKVVRAGKKRGPKPGFKRKPKVPPSEPATPGSGRDSGAPAPIEVAPMDLPMDLPPAPARARVQQLEANRAADLEGATAS